MIDRLDLATCTQLVSAFDLSFNLLNVAEENYAMQERRDEERRGRFIEGALPHYFSEQSAEALAKQLDRLGDLRITPVMTAHPTEAKRQTILEKYRAIYLLIFRLENPIWTPRERRAIEREIYNMVTLLWQTGDIHLERPTVRNEVQNILFYFKETFYDVIPGSTESYGTIFGRKASRWNPPPPSCGSARGSAATGTGIHSSKRKIPSGRSSPIKI